MDNRSYSKGISWIDDCRIPTTDKLQLLVNDGNKNIFDNSRKEPVSYGKKIKFVESIGRFPANILVSDDMLNDGVISKSEGGKGKIDKNEIFGEIKTPQNYFNFGDKGSNSRYYDIDRWWIELLNKID